MKRPVLPGLMTEKLTGGRRDQDQTEKETVGNVASLFHVLCLRQAASGPNGFR
jgi:hypothetical protein